MKIGTEIIVHKVVKHEDATRTRTEGFYGGYYLGSVGVVAEDKGGLPVPVGVVPVLFNGFRQVYWASREEVMDRKIYNSSLYKTLY